MERYNNGNTKMRKIDNPDDQGGIVPPPNPQPEPYIQPSQVSNAWGATDSIIGRILHYITNPWRFIVVVILAFLTWFGIVSYQNIDYIKNILEKRMSEPKLDLDQADKSISILMKNTGTNSVLLYKVDPGLNKKIVLRAYDTNGRDKNIEGQSIGLYSSNKENNDLVSKLMTNQIVCLEETVPVNYASIWFREKQGNYICMISLPPDSFDFVGQITIGFKEQPTNIEDIKSILLITATEIMKSN